MFILRHPYLMSIYWKPSKSPSVVKDPNFYLTNIDFDNIIIERVKYLLSSFDGDVIFILPLVKIGIPDTYDKTMDEMDKIYYRHAWCRIKTTNIQNEFGLTFRRSLYVSHLQFHNDLCEYL